ncbi:unnamed protein product [Peronospora farinosa]|uniref:Photolyase/cryptochrome alpha/beta domain-containing protein n=1 Tax=Peronospora farinosa TaxID=134698 RepID=A0ABN8BU58_9STRA|nr:unnamed protein product [Peronospora farinosa]
MSSSLPEAVKARRISEQLATLEQQRAMGNLPHNDTPLRLYQVRNGGFVRVLDQYPEPISQSMLEAIDVFIRNSTESEDLETTKAANEKKKEFEIKTEERQRDTAAMEQEHKRQEQHVEVVAADAAHGVVTAASTDKDEDDVEKTQPSGFIGVNFAPPWETATAVKRPEELLAQKERVSDCLGKHAEMEDQVETLLWPPQLEERRKLWFVPRNSGRKTSVIGAKNQPIVYWMHNTLRVMQGNYGLEAAIMLSRRLAAPLVAVCFVSASIIYPVCHAMTASDAYARYTFVELYQQFKQAGVPFYGFTAKESEMSTTLNDKHSLSLTTNPLYELLDAFEPHAVVADAMFDPPSRRDMVYLAHYLNLNRSSCSWSFLSMDSTTCCPAYQLSLKLQRTLEHSVIFASEKQFGAEYAPFVEPRNETYVFSPLPRVGAPDPVVNQQRVEMLFTILQRLHLEEINWLVVKAENAQSSTQMRRFSEGEGLQKLSQLLTGSDNQPAIQTELRGGGVLSLLPFIRHGTLFAGYVLRRIDEAIDSCPTPASPLERKALAMRKVMRSRAMKYLGKERDYVLYLSLWSTSAAGSECFRLSEIAHPDITSLCTSEIITGLNISAPRSSALDTYRKLLPTWAYSAASITEKSKGEVKGAALYDPYELESARTKDLYWNEIQKLFIEQQYLHPLLVVYWAFRILTWSVSCRAAIATIESLISQCALGSNCSPDAVVVVWKQLFRLGSTSINEISDGKEIAKLEDVRQFQHALEGEIASQPKLQLRP